MPIKVKIGSKADDDSKISIELDMRRSLDGNYMIFDHDDIDIVVMPEEKKILTLPKELITDQVYGAQNRLFSFLKKKGVIDLGSVQGGNVYGSMEAGMLEIDGAIEYVLLNISKFIDEERPYFNFLKSHEELEDQHLTEPDNEHSTELGDVGHSSQKGSLQPEYMRDVYGLHGIIQGY
tara:strand:+ start:164 stop:697 length:534 start_codon:yes stop_codon:yes gene_type:complete